MLNDGQLKHLFQTRLEEIKEREREKESNSHQEAATAAETGEEAQNGRVDGWVFLRRGYGLTLTISSRIVDTCGPVATRYLQRAFAH